MADARDSQQEAQRRSDETESRPIEEPKENEDLGIRTNEIGRIYYYNESHEEIRQYLQQERLRDAEMQRRSDETESRSIEETKGKTPDMRLSDSGRRSDERTDSIQKTESRSLPEKKDKEDSVLRINEAGQIRDYKHSNADTRENLHQHKRLRDVVEMQRRRPETESRFWRRERDRSPDRRGSESRLRFDERDPDWRESESRLRFGERAPDWRGSESRFRFDERTQDWRDSESRLSFDERSPDWRGSESRMKFDERSQDWRRSESRLRCDERSPDWRGSESQWRFDERAPDWRGSESRLRFYERTPDWRGSESRWRFDERTPDWSDSESRLSFDERSPDWRDNESQWRFDERSPDWRDSESQWRFDERSPDWRDSESQWRFDERTQRRHELVRRGEDCWCWRCRNGRSCQYNHPTQLPHELPVRIGMPICKYFMRGHCKLGSVCDFQHIKDRDCAEPMYQAKSKDWRASKPEWRFDERTQRRYEIEYSGFRPEKRAKAILDSRERDSRDRFEDPEEGEIQEQENPQEQIQRYTERQGTERAQHNLQSKIIPDSRMRDPRRHDTEWRFERERMRIASVDAQENLQEQRSRGEVKDSSHLINTIARGIMQKKREAQVREQRQRDSIERQRRDAQENLQQQVLQENRNVDAHDQQNTQELGFKRKEGDGV